MLKQVLYKTFGIRDGEIYISFLMQFYIFLIITVLLIVKPTVNALFLSGLGADQLPYGYLLVAGIAVFASYFYNKALRRFSLLRVTTLSLIFFSLSFITLALVLEFYVLNDWFLYLYYLGVSLFAVMTTSQFWILANLVFNTREAKRLFGFIGAGAIAGGVFGGYLTSIIVTSFGNVYAILVAALLILCCIPLLKKIWKLRISKLNTYIRNQRKIDDTADGESSLKIVSKSRHLSYLAIITGLGVIVAKLVDFQFSDYAHRAISDANALASFFGFWFSTFNVIALSLQLFLTNKLLSKLGVSSTLLLLPLGIVLGSILFFIFPELWVLVIIKGIDTSFKQSLNKAAVELSIMPIPFHIKNQAKSFIDVAVDSVATGFAGLLLIFVVKRLNLSTVFITVLVLFLAIIWIVLIFKLRHAYFNSFRANIQRNLIEEPVHSSKISRETTLSSAKRILESGTEEEILEVLDRLSKYKIGALKFEIIALLKHPSSKVKCSIINELYAYDKGTALEDVKSLVDEKNTDLVHAALEYILHHSALSSKAFYREYLDHESTYIANAALLCLSKESASNHTLGLQYNLFVRITEKVRQVSDIGSITSKGEIASLLLAIAYSGITKYYSFIRVYFNGRSPYLIKHAIKAAGITSDEQFIEPLIYVLSNKRYRKPAINALKNYGPQMLATIIKLDRADYLRHNIRKFLPKVVLLHNNQLSVRVLIRLLKSRDVDVRLEASKALNKLKSKNQNLNFNKRTFKNEIIRETKYAKDTLDVIASIQDSIQITKDSEQEISDENTEIMIARESIIEILEEQLQTSLKCIFKLLSLIYAEADIEVSYSGLMSDINEAKINALEFLDNLLQSQLKSRVLPLIEYYIIDKGNVKNNEIKLNIYSEKAYVTLLMKKRGRRIKLELLHLIDALNDDTYGALLTNFIKKHKDLELRKKAIAIKNSKSTPA